jgi:hypothetical protein
MYTRVQLPEAGVIEQQLQEVRLTSYDKPVPYRAIANALAGEQRNSIAVYTSVVLVLLGHSDDKATVLQAVARQLAPALMCQTARNELAEYIRQHNLP